MSKESIGLFIISILQLIFAGLYLNSYIEKKEKFDLVGFLIFIYAAIHCVASAYQEYYINILLKQ